MLKTYLSILYFLEVLKGENPEIERKGGLCG
jgi:hypothetical protein